MWERYELKDEVNNEVKLIYELKRDMLMTWLVKI